MKANDLLLLKEKFELMSIMEEVTRDDAEVKSDLDVNIKPWIITFHHENCALRATSMSQHRGFFVR